MITRFAETEFAPPARGVIVKAAPLAAGLRTVSKEFIMVVFMIDIPTICVVTLARPTIVLGISTPLRPNTN